MIGSFDWMDFLGVLAITLLGIGTGLWLRILLKRKHINGIKLPLIKKKINIVKLIMLVFGVILIIMQITYWIWLGTHWAERKGTWTPGHDDDVNGIEMNWVAYLPLFVSSYFMYFYVGYGLTKNKSVLNSMFASAIHITVLILVVFLFAMPNLFYNAIYTLSQRGGRFKNYYDFIPWYSMFYHFVALLSGIIFLVLCPYRINPYKDLLKSLIPLVTLSLMAAIVSSACWKWQIHYDAFGSSIWNPALQELYDRVGQNIWWYNFSVLILTNTLFVVSYYVYYFMVVIVPRIVVRTKRKRI